MNTRKRGRPKSLEKVNQIVTAAANLFLSEGYDRTSMQQIADAAQVSKRTLYLNFSDKEDLFKSCLVQKTVHDKEEYEPLIDLDLIPGLKAMSMTYLKLRAAPEANRMWRLMIASADSHSHLATLFYEEGMVEARKTFSRFLSKHRAELNTRKFDEAARTYVSVLAGSYSHQLLLGADVDSSESANKKRVNHAISVFRSHYLKHS